MPITTNPQLSIVIPAYCEATNIHAFVHSIAGVMDEIPYSYELIFIDDGSKDETWLEITKAAQQGAPIRALRFGRNFGKEAAIAAGLDYAAGEAVIVMDADLQHPPSLVPKMVHLWQAGNLIVEAIKEERQAESPVKRFFSKLYYTLFSQLSGVNIQHTSDFKLLDKKVIAQWKNFGERQLFFRGCIAWLGLQTTKIQYTPAQRHSGTSKWSFLQLVGLAFSTITSYSSKPLLIIWLFSALFFSLGIALSVQILYLLIMGQYVPGFFTVYVLQLVSGGLILFSLGLIATYIQQIYAEVKGRPRYVITETISTS
jgi:glycosyltransferase involved in cell wall biosynthesis